MISDKPLKRFATESFNTTSAPMIKILRTSTRSVAWALTVILIGTAHVSWASVTVTLDGPGNGTTYTAPANVQLIASASAGQGYTVSKVEFFDGTTLLATNTSGFGSVYTYMWNNVPIGNHAITAKATAIKKNSPDQTATTSVANLRINAPPVVILTSSPQNGAVFTAPASITLSANASDSDGTIVEASVGYANGFGDFGYQPVTPPYTAFTGVLTLNPGCCEDANGNVVYSIWAAATDNNEGVGAAGVQVTVKRSVTLTNPANGANYIAPATIPLEAQVSNNNNVERVEFYSGPTLIGQRSSPPYTFDWQSVVVGNYSLTAKAVSTSGATWQSLPVNVTVTSSTPASIQFIHTDHLNTPRLITNNAGQAVWRWDQADPFGGNVPNENPSGLGTFTCDLRLPGQYFDKETNLHYNYFRDYDSAIGRYIQADPVGVDGGLNLYAYVGSNPLSRVDPQGLIAIPQAPTPSIPSAPTLAPIPSASGPSATGTQICATGLFELCPNTGFITSVLSPVKLCLYECPSGKTLSFQVHKIQPCPRYLPGF